jgi:predicted nucleic acid-binding protein
MPVVSDTTAITNLAAIGRLDLLHELYGQIWLPSEVWRELVAPGQNNPGSIEAQTKPWLSARSVTDDEQVAALLQAHRTLHKAEAEAIVLALELRADLLLMDERVGRLVATKMQVPITGILGVLLDAKQRGLVAAVRPILDELRSAAGFFVSPSVYAYVLQQAGE